MRVHRNLHRKCWSLTRRGNPVEHVAAFALADVRFVVSAPGRARVVANHVRAVHAWADGTAAALPAELGPELVPVTYNPFRCGAFVRCDTGEPIGTARRVLFLADGRCLAELGGLS